jgi:hypothetical protein
LKANQLINEAKNASVDAGTKPSANPDPANLNLHETIETTQENLGEKDRNEEVDSTANPTALKRTADAGNVLTQPTLLDVMSAEESTTPEVGSRRREDLSPDRTAEELDREAGAPAQWYGDDVHREQTAVSIGVDVVVEHSVQRGDEGETAGTQYAARKDATMERLERNAVAGAGAGNATGASDAGRSSGAVGSGAVGGGALDWGGSQGDKAPNNE